MTSVPTISYMTGLGSRAVILTLIFLVNAGTASASPLEQWHQRIQSGYASLMQQAGALKAETESYCNAPSTAGRDQLAGHWRKAFDTWQAVRFVDFGPVEQNNLAWQFQFWPDPKNLVGRKAGQLLKTSSDNRTMAQRIMEGGVAVQGFPMMEYLLFDERFNKSELALPSAPACSVLTAVSVHLHNNTRELHQAWQSFKPHYLNHGQYRTTSMRAAMASLDILVERRLASPMGLRGNGKRSVYGADAWRSGHSLAAIQASVRGLRNYFLPGLALWLNESGEQALAQRIQDQTDQVLRRLEDLPKAMAPLLDDDSFPELQGLYVTLSQLQQLVNDQAAATLGVIRGFNSSDGD